MGFTLAKTIEDVRILSHFKGQDIVIFLDLIFRRMSRTVIGNGSGFNDQVAVVIIRFDSRFHVPGTADVDAPCKADRSLQVIRRTGNQRNFGPGSNRRFGNGKTHAAAGMIADEADRVDGFPRAAGRNDDFLPLEQVIFTGQQFDVIDDDVRVGQAADAGDAAGRYPLSGSMR